jgi:hypothetical protein
MDRNDVNAIIKRVKENHERLETCLGPHEFVPINPDVGVLGRVFCKKCRGEMDRVNSIYYNDGVRHGWGETARSAGYINAMVGGNHLAAVLLLAGYDPVSTETWQDAQKNLRPPYADIWFAWKQIMELRKQVEGR